jgi:hypothetical protein
VFVVVRSNCTSNVAYQMTHVTLHSSDVPRHAFYHARHPLKGMSKKWASRSGLQVPLHSQPFENSLLNVKTLTTSLLYNQYPSLWSQEAFTLVASDMSC